MLVRRFTEPEVLNFLKPHLLEPDGFDSVEDFIETFREMMVNIPEYVCVMVAADREYGTDGEWEPVVKMFAIAYGEPHRSHAFVVQAWADPQLDGRHIQDEVLNKVVAWADVMGMREVRCETTRSQAFERRYPEFREVSRMLSLDTTQYIANAWKRRVEDERGQQTKHEQVSEGRPDLHVGRERVQEGRGEVVQEGEGRVVASDDTDGERKRESWRRPTGVRQDLNTDGGSEEDNEGSGATDSSASPERTTGV